MSYIPHTPEEIQEMLEVIGVTSIKSLFDDAVPSELRVDSFDIPRKKTEFEAMEYMQNLAKKNSTGHTLFLGGGFYDHYIPSAIDALAGRSEFYTAYTPYQPEASQGTLQALYEYQTTVCNLMDMDVANASLYDGGTALAEAALMAFRIKRRSKIIVDQGVNPLYRSILHSYLDDKFQVVEIPLFDDVLNRGELKDNLDKDVAAVIFQNPNFFGSIDDYSDVVEMTHSFGALAIASVYPVSLGLVKTPGEMGVDIVTAEGQSLGIPLSFGGPYLGIIAAKKKYVRQIPGRIVGCTVDTNNNRSFVLTLQAREQHIRRASATSNICSNQGLCALRALFFLSLVGKSGIKELAEFNYKKANYAKEVLSAIPGITVKNTHPVFNEFVIQLPKDSGPVIKGFMDEGIIPGLPLDGLYPGYEDRLLVTVTEKRKKEDIDRFAQILKTLI